MGAMIGLVFLFTVGAAGWIHGSLGVMSAGFAAILIGLTVDYGVLICQEAKLAKHDAAEIRRAVTGSIGWAATTTAAVFAALNFSSIPGDRAVGQPGGDRGDQRRGGDAGVVCPVGGTGGSRAGGEGWGAGRAVSAWAAGRCWWRR
jgi:hypothetical protein